MVLIGGCEARVYRGTHTRPHTGSVQFIFWAELRYLSLPAFVPSTAIPRSAFDINGTNRPLLTSTSPRALKRIDASRSLLLASPRISLLLSLVSLPPARWPLNSKLGTQRSQQFLVGMSLTRSTTTARITLHDWSYLEDIYLNKAVSNNKINNLSDLKYILNLTF